MKTKLRNEVCMNPYYIMNNQVNSIIFYDESGVIVASGRGWFGNNKIDIIELNELELVRKNKLNLTKSEHFYIKSEKTNSYNNDVYYDVYVYVPKSRLEVEYLGEQVACDFDDRKHYGNFFNITATFQNELDRKKYEHKTKKFMTAYYTKTVLKDNGIKAEKFVAFMEKNDLKLSSRYNLHEKLQDNAFINELTSIINS